MSNDIRVNTEVVRGFIVYSRIVGWLLVAVSLIVLLAWVSAVAPLQMFALPATSMRAGAALAGVLAGGALLLSHRWPWSSFLLSLLLTLLAGCELLEFASGAKVICLPDLGGAASTLAEQAARENAGTDGSGIHAAGAGGDGGRVKAGDLAA
ncbi:hypothetical protein [Thermomonas sp.]|uniref:hypothetical protein n=1 Tax=Thermomonas sp. TaxID=1971895 RepID=UPI0037835007